MDVFICRTFGILKSQKKMLRRDKQLLGGIDETVVAVESGLELSLLRCRLREYSAAENTPNCNPGEDCRVTLVDVVGREGSLIRLYKLGYPALKTGTKH